jgi:hypothetical protein
METKRHSENSESTNLELVLEQFANEQKSQTKSINELISAINSLSKHVINFEEDLLKPKPISVSTNTLSIQEMIKKAVVEIKLIFAGQQQKPVLKKYQLLLFPEQDSKLFYKIVFGRWFLWLIVMLFLTNLYKFAIHESDNQKEIKVQVLQNDRIIQAWNYLYFKGDKVTKKLMDNAYYRSGQH